MRKNEITKKKEIVIYVPRRARKNFRSRMIRPYAKRVRGRNKKERKVKSEKRKQDLGKKINRKRARNRGDDSIAVRMIMLKKNNVISSSKRTRSLDLFMLTCKEKIRNTN